MITGVGAVSILVHDQDEALRFYTEMLGFEKQHDQEFDTFGRWVDIKVPGSNQTMSIALLQASDETFVGKTPPWWLMTDDCAGDYAELQNRGVNFVQAPTMQPWGLEAIFEDLYGNRIILLQAGEPAAAGAT